MAWNTEVYSFPKEQGAEFFTAFGAPHSQVGGSWKTQARLQQVSLAETQLPLAVRGFSA